MNVLNPDGAPVGVGVTHVDDATAMAMPSTTAKGSFTFTSSRARRSRP